MCLILRQLLPALNDFEPAHHSRIGNLELKKTFRKKKC